MPFYSFHQTLYHRERKGDYGSRNEIVAADSTAT